MRRQLNSGQNAFRGKAGGETFQTYGVSTKISDAQRRGGRPRKRPNAGLPGQNGLPDKKRDTRSEAMREEPHERPASFGRLSSKSKIDRNRFTYSSKRHQEFAMSLEQAGYVIIDKVIANAGCKSIANQVLAALQRDHQSSISREGHTERLNQNQRKSRSVVGGRNLLSFWSDWRQVTEDQRINDLILQSVGDQAGLVRGLYFDKPPGQGWALALHRDLTIAVAEHREPASPFSKPTRKGGVPHVEATQELLGAMLTLRIHLDPMVEGNGPLVVVPGSHREVGASSFASAEAIYCHAGDVFVMRPLLVHGSRACDPKTTLHRRVIHLEIAPSERLPGGYRWHHFEPLF